MNSATMRSPLSVVSRRPFHVDRGLGLLRMCRAARSRIGCLDSPGRSPRSPSPPPSWFRRPDNPASTWASGPAGRSGSGPPSPGRRCWWCARNPAGGHLRGESCGYRAMQDLLRDRHLFGAVAVGQRRQRYADGVPDALLQQRRQRRRWSHDSLAAHAGLRQAEVQRIIAGGRQGAVQRRSNPARRSLWR